MVRYESSPGRRTRNSITRDEIVRVARETAENGGMGAVTVRAVAAAMDASPMSLYNHFPTKESLIDAVLDDVIRQLETRDDTARPWDAAMIAYGLSLADHLAAHGWAVLPLISRPDPGEHTTRIGEAVLAMGLRGGLDAERAVTAFTAILALVYGRAAFLAAAGTRGAQTRAEVEAVIAGVDPLAYPATASVVHELANYGSRRQLEIALTALVAGLTTG